MFWRHNTAAGSDIDLQESIKRDIEKNLSAKGVVISGVNMEIKPKNILLRLQLQRIKPR